MTNQIPTIEEVLSGCELRGWRNGEKLLAWSTNGGEIMVPISELRTALETAYDPTMPDWPAMADIEDSDS
jgi:hypothetical protein